MSSVNDLLEKAERIADERVSAVEARLAELKVGLEAAQDLLKNAFGIEDQEKGQIESKIGFYQAEVTKLEKLLSLYKNYPRISCAWLYERDHFGFPEFVLFGIGSSKLTFFVNVWGFFRRKYESSENVYIPEIQNIYTDVIDRLKRRAEKEKKHVSLTYKFHGLIPKETREKIKAAQKVFSGSDLFLLAQPGEVHKSGSSLEIDSLKSMKVLVVGYFESNLWEVDSFIPATVEEAIASYRTETAPAT